MSVPTTPGFHIVRIFAQELHLQGVADDSGLPEGIAWEFGWDWQVQDEERFYVVIGARGGPAQNRTEKISVVMVGEFRRVGIPEQPTLRNFVTLNAPNILMPYIREAIANLTSRGAIGILHVPPVNVIQLMKSMSFEKADGTAALRARPELAAAYGVPEDALGEAPEATEQP